MPGRKIAILGTRGIPAQHGGFETFAEEIAIRLVSHGLEVTVYCMTKKRRPQALYKGVRLVSIAVPRLGPLTTIIFDLLCLWKARKGFDLVYMLGYGSSLFTCIPRLWGTPVWINMDGLEWKRSKWGGIAKTYLKIMEFIAMRFANRIIADAEGIKAFLYERHRVDTPCAMIAYGTQIIDQVPSTVILDERRLKPYHYYLVVCRLEPENHVQEVVEGYSRSGSSLPLVVVGDHRKPTAYVRRLLEWKSDRVQFYGAIYDRDRLAELRYYCTAYLHGHSVGGTNPSLLEALGCGNIVIAHDNPFNREVAGDAATYFNNSDEIPAIIGRLETMNDAQRTSAAARARKRIQDHYTWERITDAYIALLRDDIPLTGKRTTS